MKKYFLWSLLICLSCRVHKKSTETAKTEQPVKTDSIKPVVTVAPAAREVYRAANKRLSDIIHTKLEVNFDWTNCRMNGKATLRVRPYFYPTDKLYLDARGMDIRSVEVFDGGAMNDQTTTLPSDLKKVANASFVYENDSLKINLGKTFTKDQGYHVVIDYVAKPNELKNKGGSNAITDDRGLYFINPTGENKYKMPQIWTQGETQSNSVWMPTIDSPNEKMTQEILITVLDRFTTLSNGRLVGSAKNADGTRTDHWRLDSPHAPYLAMMAVGEFVKVTDKPWNDREISFYVEKMYEPYAAGIFGDTREMVDFFSRRLGVDFPWPKYAQIAVRDYVSGAMENTSATLHGDFMVYQTAREMIDGKKGTDVISHELFHQWFGDLVTAESWSNLPLNESFATYGEYLWREYKDGREAADYHHWQSRQGYLASKNEVNIIRYNYHNREDVFDAYSYNKGGQVLHMLRKAVGDDAFFAALKNYLETNRFRPAEIHQLRLAFEETTGSDMNWFFNQWFLNKGRPKLKVVSNYDAAEGLIELTVEQTQDLSNTPLYRLPLDVDVYINGKVERTRIVIEDQKQVFWLKAGSTPQLVNFDAERQLLCDLDYTKRREEYMFQYANGPLYEDRLEALKALEDDINDDAVFNLFATAATADRFHALRNYAIGRLEKVNETKAPATKAVFGKIYGSDTRTLTRARALEALNKKFAGDADVKALNEKALTEPSYAICGEALEAITRSDPKLAMTKAKLFENEYGKDIVFPVASLYASHGGDDNLLFFQKALPYVGGFELVTFISLYAKTAKRCTTSTGVIAAAMDFETLCKGAGKFSKFAALKALKDVSAAWEVREKTERAALENARKASKDTATMEKELTTTVETRDILIKMYERSK